MHTPALAIGGDGNACNRRHGAFGSVAERIALGIKQRLYAPANAPAHKPARGPAAVSEMQSQ